MGCIPSKNISTVHPINSSNDSSTTPDQAPTNGNNSQIVSSDNTQTTVLAQEYPDPPSSTPEPVNPEHILNSPLATELQAKLQNHVKVSQDSTQYSGDTSRPKLQRQATIIHSEEDVHVSTNCQSSNGNFSNMDNSNIQDSSKTLDSVPTQCISNNNRSNEQFGRPSCSTERAYNRSNPTLRLYGTDSQIEFFKMLDKKIEEGPDFFEESDETS